MSIHNTHTSSQTPSKSHWLFPHLAKKSDCQKSTGSNDCEGFNDGLLVTDGNKESEGDNDGLLDNRNPWHSRKSQRCVRRQSRSKCVADGVGFGEPVGDALGPVVVDVGALDAATDDGGGDGSGERDALALG